MCTWRIVSLGGGGCRLFRTLGYAPTVSQYSQLRGPSTFSTEICISVLRTVLRAATVYLLLTVRCAATAVYLILMVHLPVVLDDCRRVVCVVF